MYVIAAGVGRPYDTARNVDRTFAAMGTETRSPIHLQKKAPALDNGAWISTLSDGERDAFKAAMRHLVGGVSIVTVSSGDRLNGLTATSVTSLSADPPSLIVCIHRQVSGISLLRESGRFGVSILGEGHQDIADRFAGRDGRRGADRYDGAEWIGTEGAPPVLADALASFDCLVEDMIEKFSHTIVIGRVTASRARGGDSALVYWRAAYGRMV